MAADLTHPLGGLITRSGRCRQTFTVTRSGIIALLIGTLVTTGCHPLLDWYARSFVLPGEGIRSADYAVQTERRLGFTTSDGISLLADVHRPVGLERTPTVLIRIPFTNTIGNRLRSDVIARYWASRGYTVVIQGTRGRYESGGNFYPLIHERQDGIETLAWLAQQPWFDGRVGMWGGSAFGHTQWAVADQTTPGLGALFVHIASTNFHAMFFPGNAFSLESAVYWTVRSRGNRDRTVDISALDRGVNTLPLINADLHAIGDTDFFNDWLLNQHDEAYWHKIDGIDRAETLKAPVLLMGGWFDPFLPSQLTDYLTVIEKALPAVATQTRLIIGPWGHASTPELPGPPVEQQAYRVASIAPAVAWFDYHLGVRNDPLDMPPVRLFVMGINQWRDEDEWPLQRTRYTRFHLHSDGDAGVGNGRLDTEVPPYDQSADGYTYDPANPTPSAGGAMLGPRSGVQRQNKIEARPDVLVYTTEQLPEPLEVTGPVKAVLYVSTDAPSTDFAAKLVDVHPDASAYNLTDGILRQSYHDNNEPVRIEIELWPTSHVFLPGHQIRLEISSANFPRYDRNLNTGDLSPHATTMRIARQHIYHTPQYPSHIVLPVIPGNARQGT